MRSLVNQMAIPSPLKFFLPWPWILKCTLSSQSRSWNGWRAGGGGGGGGGVGWGEQVIPESRRRWEEETERTHHPSITTTPPTLSSRHGGTYDATPHGSLAALEVRGQSHVVRGHHGRAHQIPLRGRGETQTCDTHTRTQSKSHQSDNHMVLLFFRTGGEQADQRCSSELQPSSSPSKSTL